LVGVLYDQFGRAVNGTGRVPTGDHKTSVLLIIDFQTRLILAIEDSTGIVANTQRVLDGARLLGVPTSSSSRTQRP